MDDISLPNNLEIDESNVIFEGLTKKYMNQKIGIPINLI